jgi:hypothetical protein
MSANYFPKQRFLMNLLHRFTIFLTFALALGIRLYDLTDPPFDFHSTRQFRSAVIARGMYYARLSTIPSQQRELAIDQWHGEQQLELPMIEWVAALTYHLPGGEALWKARLLSSLFWLSGGLALYFLAIELSSPVAALIGVLLYLFLPYGIIASRSFQPDPLMVALTVFAVWRLYCWYQTRAWRDALLAGALSGLAVLSKAVALFPIGGVAFALLFIDRDWKKSLQDSQTWGFGLLALAPGTVYYGYGLFIARFLQGQAKQSFLPHLWLDPVYYVRWVNQAVDTTGFAALWIGVISILLWQTKTARVLTTGWWTGYIIYGLAFPYHTMTHDYYQLPLIPIAALSLTPAIHLIIRQLVKNGISKWGQGALATIIAGAVLFQVWNARTELARKSYLSDAKEWSRFQTIIPPDRMVVALVQAYGYPLKYYGWVNAALWATTGDINLRELSGKSPEDIEEKRWSQLEGMDWFLVTNFNEFNRQPDLQEFLTTNFMVFDEGEGYVIFDLNAPLK